jgi:hypothetical protein
LVWVIVIVKEEIMINDLEKITESMCNSIDLINECVRNINNINRRCYENKR